MSRLWELLKTHIETGNETSKVDLKQTLDLSTPSGRREFAKDVAAMANTSGGVGYLIVGVMDQKRRTRNDPAEYVIGFTPNSPHVFEQQMTQSLNNYCQAVPEVRYEEVIHPTTARKLGVVVIPRSFQRPYKVEGQIYVRRGTHTVQATEEEIKQAERRILVNMHRPIEEHQRKKLEELLGATIDEVIDVNGNLDEKKDTLPQVRAMFDAIGLTPAEWQGLPIVVNIHPFAPAASLVLAWIHGVRGFFPEVVRMVRDEQLNRFEVVELIKLQSVRNETRDWVNQFAG